MVSEIEDFSPAFNIPQVDDSISASRSNNSAVGSETHRSDPVGVAEEALDELLGSGLRLVRDSYVVDLHTFVVSSRHDKSTVWAPSY